MKREFVPVLVAVAMAMPPISRAAAEGGVVHINPAGAVSDWVMDEAGGRVFAVLAGEEGVPAVVEYDPLTGTELRRFPVGPNPFQLLVKGETLVVSIRDGVALEFIDIEKNEKAGRVRLEGGGPYAIFASRVENGFVYAYCRPDGLFGHFYQIDLKTRSVRKQAEVARFWQSGLGSVMMSADGKWAIASGLGGGTSATILLKVDEGAGAFEKEFSYKRNFGYMNPGPSNRYWAMGAGLWPLDLVSHRRETGAGEYDPQRRFGTADLRTPILLAIHPTRDFCLSAEFSSRRAGKQVLRFYSFERGEILGRIELGERSPFQSIHSAKRIRIGPDLPSMSIAPRQARALVGNGNDGYVVDLAKAGLPDEGRLTLELPASAELVAGERWSVPLKLSDATLAPGAKFILEEAPEGCSTEGGRLAWQPGDSDLGPHRIVIAANEGGVEVRAQIGLHVAAASIPFDDPFFGFRIAPDGERALVLTRTKDVDTLTVVDLGTRRKTASRNLPERVAFYMVDGETILYAHRIADTSWASDLVRLESADLSEAKRARLEGGLSDLVPAPGGRVAVLSSRGHKLFDARSLEPVEGFDEIANMKQGDPGQGFQPLSGAFQLGPYVVDRGGKEILWHVPPGIRGQDHLPHPWSRNASQGRLNARHNLKIYEIDRHQGTAMSPDHPVFVSANHRVDTGVGGLSELSFGVEFRDLVGVKQLPTLRLIHRSPQAVSLAVPRDRPFVRDYRSLQTAGGRVVTRYHGKLFVRDLPLGEIAQFEIPLHFDHTIKVPDILTEGEPTTFGLRAKGGSGGYRFELYENVDGIEIEEETGVVAVDGAAIWATSRSLLESGKTVLRLSGGSSWLDFIATVKDSEGATDYIAIALKLPVPAEARALAKVVEGFDGDVSADQIEIQMAGTQQKIEQLAGSVQNITGQIESLRDEMARQGTERRGGGGSKLPYFILTGLAAVMIGLLVGKRFGGG